MNYGRMKMGEICTDDRFELIQKYKEKLIQGTNIETAKEEMNVIDNILFRFWQMGWLEALEKQIPKKPTFEGDGFDGNGNITYDTWICPCCEEEYEVDYDDHKYCPWCGQMIDWSDKTN